MNDFFEKKVSGSVSEKKRKYIQHWLENNSYPNADFNTDCKEKTFLNLNKINKKCRSSFILPVPSKLNQKQSTSCLHPLSPILSGKRSSFNLPNHRKFTTKINADCKKNDSVDLIKKTIEKSKTESNCEQYCKQSLLKCDVFLPNSIKLLNHDNKFEISSTTKCFNSINKTNLYKNINNANFFKKSSIVEEFTLQCIESTSSESESNERNEINSDTDKTASDLIEDTSTQVVLETSFKQNDNSLSQNISNPSSISSESINNIYVSESISIDNDDNKKSLETFIPMDVVHCSSSLFSKIDNSKTSYILQYKTEKQRKKKNPKKGTLLDILYIKMGKERSNVNLLRHQLYKKPPNTIIKPFILLQIIQHLPMINESQLLKCILIEDTMNLLNNLLKKQNHRYITVINVPEISCLINTIQKPILKIYEPWTILDPNQLFLHITRFIAIPTTTTNKTGIISDSDNTDNFKVKQEFNCPCIHEKILSNKCKLKLQDNLCNLMKITFNYK